MTITMEQQRANRLEVAGLMRHFGPEHFYMDHWFVTGQTRAERWIAPQLDLVPEHVKDYLNECGTTACLAGFGVAAGGPKDSVYEMATWLGIDHHCFYPEWWNEYSEDYIGTEEDDDLPPDLHSSLLHLQRVYMEHFESADSPYEREWCYYTSVIDLLENYGANALLPPEPPPCDHEFRMYDQGASYHSFECIRCGYTYTVDTGD